MNREIKFRGKSTLCDTWLYGLLVRVGCMYYIAEENDFDTDGHHIKQVQDMPLDVERDTIGQFTGLYDRNQNAIYEDDILQLTNNGVKLYSVVKWNEELGAWCIILEGDLKEGSRPLGRWLCDRDYKIEVIGNIFDNKDLLNKE